MGDRLKRAAKVRSFVLPSGLVTITASSHPGRSVSRWAAAERSTIRLDGAVRETDAKWHGVVRFSLTELPARTFSTSSWLKTVDPLVYHRKAAKTRPRTTSTFTGAELAIAAGATNASMSAAIIVRDGRSAFGITPTSPPLWSAESGIAQARCERA
jgi:hypothetical protein